MRESEQQVRKTSHFGSKQQQTSHAVITPLLLVRATHKLLLFLVHILFMVYNAFNNVPTEWLQQYIAKN